ncbi:MAG: hypothetical protein U9Q63_02115, partial [Patescibacteria group bacterium]|nr:hypothetical protein [Patescibacteria group bacterium]
MSQEMKNRIPPEDLVSKIGMHREFKRFLERSHHYPEIAIRVNYYKDHLEKSFHMGFTDQQTSLSFQGYGFQETYKGMERLLEKPKAILARKLHALDTEEELSASNCVDLLENQRQIKDYFWLKRKDVKKKRKKIIRKIAFIKNPEDVEISKKAL